MIGHNISHYKITSKLGEGGMGEVYRATDTKLNRDVALKVLPEAFAADRERMARFSREAQVLASLNHPNIASIYGLEDSNDKHALVLELVEGETLAERIKGGAIPLEESLKIALQMAEALEAAHEKGIIHRDLKPANVKITPEGKVKVLDFGLAKALEGEIPASDLTSSPTKTGPAVGVIMGTAGYMSPEQARGQAVDKRTDIWAFGCVLYEVLTGRQAFAGETVTDILAAIVHKEPDWEALPDETPWGIQRLLRRCLQKDPHDRLRHIGDAGIEVREALSEPLVVAPQAVEAPPARSSWRQVLPWFLFGIATIAALTFALIESDEAPRQSDTTHFLLPQPETVKIAGNPIVSPDGRQIFFVGLDNFGKGSVWLQRLNSPIALRLSGMDQALPPFWSPDSRFIGFLAEGKLKKMDLSGRSAVSLADAPDGGGGGTWSRQGTILFSSGGIIYGVSAVGGEATAVTQLDHSRQETRHAKPHFLPDGRHFLFRVWTNLAKEAAIYVGSLDSGDSKFLVNMYRNSGVAYSPPGYLLFVRDKTLMAQRFDVNQLEVTGEVFPIAKGMGRVSSFSVSENGVLAYQPFSMEGQLVWRDRSGKLLETVGERGGHQDIEFSPDKQRVAVVRDEGTSGLDIWLLELSTGIFSRWTRNPLMDTDPTWSPDGSRLVFASRRNGPAGLFQKTVGGSEVEVLFENDAHNWPKDWSRNGDIVFLSTAAKGNSLNALRQNEKGMWESRVLLEEPLGRDAFQLSPDEKWISYYRQSGTREVYIAAFPDFSNERRVSRDGGAHARWRGDGKELFYLQLDGKLMSAEVKQGAILETGIPKVLFETSASPFTFNHTYDVSRDGQRFLINESEERFGPIHVVLNWFEELKRLVPTEN